MLRLERTLDIGLDPDGDNADIDNRDPRLHQSWIGRESHGDAVANGGHAVRESLRQGNVGEQVKGVLLCQFGEQASELLERRRSPGSQIRVNAEVEPGGGNGRVGDPVGHRRLHGHAWKSSVRPWNTRGCSRSSIGTSLNAAVSGRNQNASPGPSWASLPLRRCRTCAVGLARRWRRNRTWSYQPLGSLSRQYDDDRAWT